MLDLRVSSAAPSAILVRATLLAVSILASVALPAPAASGSDAVVVRYREVIGEIAEADRGPSLEVHADGRLRVHFPAYMRRAGDWETTLDAATLHGLVQSLIAHGVRDFDAAAVRARQRQSRAARAANARRRPGEPLLFEASDASTIEITLRTADGEHTASWTGLRSDSEQYPELPELGALRAAQRTLQALMAHPGLVRRGSGGARP